MDTKRWWLVFILVIAFVVILFNLKYLGFSVMNTTSNFTISGPYSFPFFGVINSSLFVCEGKVLYYEFNASDLDGDALTGDISPRDPFYLFWISQATPNTQTFAIVSGKIDKTDVGGVNSGFKLYSETITIDDGYNSTCCTNSTKTNITIIEINNAPVIEDVGVQTVYTQGDNSTFYKSVGYDDTEYNSNYGNIFFNISIVNSTTGTSVNLFNITAEGIINFTANSSTSLGVYNITICINDTGLTNVHQNISVYCNQTGASLYDCDNFSLTVTDENRRPNVTSYYPKNLSFSASGENLYFNVTVSDPDGTTPDVYWYTDGSFAERDSGSSFAEFSYTFGCGTGMHNVSVDATDGLLNASLTWSVSVSDCGAGISSGGGGGGGAPISNINFQVEPEFLTATIFKEEGKSFDIKIKNVGVIDIKISSDTSNLTDMAILNEDNFTLRIGEEKTIRLYLYALSTAKPGVYFGKVIFRSGIVEKKVNVVLEVKERKALFDIKVIVPTEFKSVNAGQDINVLVDMLNVGLYGTSVDVEFFLYITDFDKFIIYETSKEVVAVKTNLSVERKLHVPLGTPSGSYLVLGEAKYGNITVSTYDTFNVTEKKYLRASYILIITAIIILIILLIFFLYKRRKKQKDKDR